MSPDRMIASLVYERHQGQVFSIGDPLAELLSFDSSMACERCGVPRCTGERMRLSADEVVGKQLYGSQLDHDGQCTTPIPALLASFEVT